MAEDEEGAQGDPDTMQGNLKEKPADARSFDDKQYAGESEPSSVGTGGDAGGANVSRQGGGSGSSKQAGNTGSSTSGSR